MRTDGAYRGAILSRADLDRIRRHLGAEEFQQAYRFGETFGPITSWVGADSRLLAARLAFELGAPSTARKLVVGAYREAPAHPSAFCEQARLILQYRGPWDAWRRLKSIRNLHSATPDQESDRLALRAECAIRMRDFTTAEQLVTEAEMLTPGRSGLQWLRVENLASQDQYEAALALAREWLKVHDRSLWALRSTAHLLQLSGRLDEAIELLQRTHRQVESGAPAAQLAVMLMEAGRPAEASPALDHFAALTPLRDRLTARWLASRSSEAAYRAGRWGAAVAAAQTGDGDLRRFAARCDALAAGTTRIEESRQVLPVTFVRQHHLTCAPATLAALSNFWGRPAAHLEIARAICFNGTARHHQRRWAEENGWVTRVFRVTRETTIELIQRGIPFALATSDVGMGHLQAVIGYDLIRDTLIIRDPTLPDQREFSIDPFLESQKATGPEGTVILPPDRADVLTGLRLPDVEAFNALFRINVALEGHGRTEAGAECARLERELPGHWITRRARLIMAAYDGHPPQILAAAESLLELFPDDASLLLCKLRCLRELVSRADCIAWLRQICRRPKRHPLLARELAHELCADPATAEEAARWLARIGRRPEESPEELALQAGLEQRRNEQELALEQLRFAACLDDKSESRAWAYFALLCDAGRSIEALAHLKDRFQRFGRRCGHPAITYFRATEALDRPDFNALDQALEWRPEDGDLLRFATDQFSAQGQFVRADALLESAVAHSSRLDGLRVMARTAWRRGRRTEALASWREVVAADPLSLGDQEAFIGLLLETDGRAAASRHLESVCAQFPNHLGLHFLWSRFVESSGAVAQEGALRRLIAIHPARADVHQALAACLRRLQHPDEALASLEEALRLEPGQPSLYTFRGTLHQAAGRMAEARADFRRAIEMSAEELSAMRGLLDVCTSPLPRTEAIAFIRTALLERGTPSQCLVLSASFRGRLSPREMLSLLEALRERHAGQRQPWSAVLQLLTEMRELTAALKQAESALRTFPSEPALWLDLAAIRRIADDPAGEREALNKAAELNPASLEIQRKLAVADESQGRLQEAHDRFESLAARLPNNVVVLSSLGGMQWGLGKRETALETIRAAAQLDPSYDWSWTMLRQWGLKCGKPGLDLHLARELTEQRPADSRSWLRLAEVLRAPNQVRDRLAAIEQALAHDPTLIAAHDLRAQTLSGQRRYDEAALAARPVVFGQEQPPALRVRQAVIEADRGRIAPAIEQLRAFLADHPDCFAAWHELARWRQHAGDLEGACEAAETMGRLEPLDPVTELYRGQLEAARRHHESAKEHFRRALQLNPKDPSGARNLFDVQVADGELRQARETLDLMVARFPGADTLVQQIRMTILCEDLAGAFEHFAQLCTSETLDPAPMREAASLLVRCGLGEATEKALIGAARSKSCNEFVGSELVWVRMATRTDFQAWRQLKCFRSQAALLQRGLKTALVELARAATPEGTEPTKPTLAACRRSLRALVRAHRQWLREDEAGWLLTAQAWGAAQCPHELLDWMRDWPSRRLVTPWMLHEYVQALMITGRHRDVPAVARHAVERLPADEATRLLEVWLSLAEAIEGHESVARQLLGGISTEQLGDFHARLHRLASGLVEVGTAAPQERKAVAERVVAGLKTEYPRRARHVTDPALRAAFVETTSRLARHAGMGTKLWNIGQRYLP